MAVIRAACRAEQLLDLLIGESLNQPGLAKRRFTSALHNLARLGEADDPATARERYERAARAGELRAAVNLARMMLEGAGGPQDVVSALEWTRKAADGGTAAGLNNLGRMYELGLGVTADAAEARRLYGEAAALGYELAAENLARLGG